MPDFALTRREADLVRAALSADPATATAAWTSWIEAGALEDAPHAELRLLPVVYANLSAIAPGLALPPKLRGKARATFTLNRLIVHESLPALQTLSPSVPVMVSKGAAFCARFDAWSFRQTGDLDIHVPERDLPRAVDLLTAAGWIPKYGMTALSLKHRTPLRRNSWGLTKDKGDIDLHWRLRDSPEADALARRFWKTADLRDLFGVAVRMPSPEFSVAGALCHGLVEGTRADALQMLVDCWYWLPICDRDKLADALALADVSDLARSLAAAYAEAGLSRNDELLTAAARPSPRASMDGARVRPDAFVTRQRVAYRLWNALGQRPNVEQWMLRLLGPFSKPLAPPNGPREEYDLRNCSVIDEIGGSGWGWPEPEHTCFWSDQGDNRLLVTVPERRDYVAILSLSPHARASPHPRVSVFVNGWPTDEIDFQISSRGTWTIPVPRTHLVGPWIEFSFRPMGFDPSAFAAYGERRSLPAVRLQVVVPDGAASALAARVPTPLQQKIDRGEEPYLSRFKRVEAAMLESPYKNDPRLPADFDPVYYVLRYDDLLNAEVDPFQHFVLHGQDERRWY